MAPSFLTEEQVRKFEDDGYLVVPDFFDKQTGDKLIARTKHLLANFPLEGHPMTKFSTGEKDSHVGDDYFLTSSDKIRDAFDGEGNLTRPKEQAINKIGHALHELDPDFRRFSLENERLRAIATDLGRHKDPLVLQSMIICKQPRIGGKVPPHIDSTFLTTEPPTALGFWFALEPSSLKPTNNGCLSFVPGSHKRNRVATRFVRQPGGGTGFEPVPGVEEVGIDWEKENWVTEECEAGALVLIDGLVVHKSERNVSDRSRYIYTFHMIEAGARYDEKNWLQPTPSMPFSRLFGKT